MPGRTAIPEGRYRVRTTYSPRFRRDLPLVENVPGFEGVRIHPGNTAADTEGCILPGSSRDPQGRVLDSRSAFRKLGKLIRDAEQLGEEVFLTIVSGTDPERK